MVRLATAFLVTVICAHSGVDAMLKSRAGRPLSAIVSDIRAADYAGDRAKLEALFLEAEPFTTSGQEKVYARYWRGFAKWRNAINGNNENIDAKILAQLCQEGATEFEASVKEVETFVEGKIGALGAKLLYLYFSMSDQEKVAAQIPAVTNLARELRASAPDNPRLVWVLGPGLLRTPVERGGGFENVIASYEKALAKLATNPPKKSHPLDPDWAEAELEMSLGWTYLNAPTPDKTKAEMHARKALKLVPTWHYVKDILLPQILKN